MVEKKFCSILKLYFSLKIGVKSAEKAGVMETYRYYFWIQRENFVQKHLYFQKKTNDPQKFETLCYKITSLYCFNTNKKDWNFRIHSCSGFYVIEPQSFVY